MTLRLALFLFFLPAAVAYFGVGGILSGVADIVSASADVAFVLQPGIIVSLCTVSSVTSTLGYGGGGYGGGGYGGGYGGGGYGDVVDVGTLLLALL
jgi:hypothetical protein